MNKSGIKIKDFYAFTKTTHTHTQKLSITKNINLNKRNALEYEKKIYGHHIFKNIYIYL